MRISDWSSDVCSSDLKTEDPQAFIDAVELLEPSFGGINLEDIAAPNCFIIEAALKERMNIPAFHDDQQDRKSVGSGKSVSVRVDLGGSRIIKKKKKETQ